MKLEIEVYDAVCRLSTFRINGINADEDEFVDKYDHSPWTAGEYTCGDMQADILPATDKVMGKYRISLEEYADIAEKVSEKVSFGYCGLCV